MFLKNRFKKYNNSKTQLEVTSNSRHTLQYYIRLKQT